MQQSLNHDFYLTEKIILFFEILQIPFSKYRTYKQNELKLAENLDPLSDELSVWVSVGWKEATVMNCTASITKYFFYFNSEAIIKDTVTTTFLASFEMYREI